MNLRILPILLVVFPLYAQLELPEYLFVDDPTEEETLRSDEGHKKTGKAEKPKEIEAETKAAADQRAQILMMVNNPGPIVLRGNGMRGMPDNQPENTAQIKRLTGGAAELSADLKLLKGNSLKGILANQVIRVEAAFGSLPLRLGELQRMRRQEDGSYLFEIRGGDILRGKPLIPHLTLTLPDGGKRVVSLQDLSTLDLTPIEAESLAP